MLKVVCVGYREWANNIYKRLSESTSNLFLMMDTDTYNESIIYDFKPDFILFYGWSDIVKGTIIQDFNCLMLHPSKLPLYRGGSPIQNQIIDGVINSAVTVFRMDDKMDNGPILGQEYLSLMGSLQDIFKRIEDCGFNISMRIFSGHYVENIQNTSHATYCKRRKPSESEITIDEILNEDSEYLFNKVRMLADPYPNAYIRTKDGKRLLLKEVAIDKSI